jgi:hypothetical protein
MHFCFTFDSIIYIKFSQMIFSRRRNKKEVGARSLLSLLTCALLLRLRYSKCKSYFIADAYLPKPGKAPLRLVLESGDDNAFLAATSLKKAAFMELLHQFSRFYERKCFTRKGGRPPRLADDHAVLGMLLRYYCDPCDLKSICQLHGIPKATASRSLRRAEVALSNALRSLPSANFRWPTLEEQPDWARRVEAKYPLLKGRWGFIDGKNYKIQKPSRSDIQNAMYNG